MSELSGETGVLLDWLKNQLHEFASWSVYSLSLSEHFNIHWLYTLAHNELQSDAGNHLNIPSFTVLHFEVLVVTSERADQSLVFKFIRHEDWLVLGDDVIQEFVLSVQVEDDVSHFVKVFDDVIRAVFSQEEELPSQTSVEGGVVHELA